MTDGTTAIPTTLLTQFGDRRALCPACVGGRLHPYKVSINLGGFEGYRHGSGFVAVCAGARPDLDECEEPIEACGFAMAITPQR